MSTNSTPLPAPRAKCLRIFAGPNGSGKTTVYEAVAERFRVGAYVNAEQLQRRCELSAGVSLQSFLPSLTGEDFQTFYSEHPLRADYESPFPFIVRPDGRLTLSETCDHSPKLSFAMAILADYLLARLVEAGAEISFEAVFSQPSELALMRRARESGYRVCLYYVCVASPEVSKRRIALRLTQGGGVGVPDAEVVAQYAQSLAALKDAVALSDSACLFDNTYSGASLKLEIRNGSDVIAHEPVLPDWITRSLPALVAK